ncbi:ChbG/HpnK family deacetylase [Streptomyces sp. NPDC057554]|uniref:ChbG/HpnK family deacetylase n=1 Tax=Streptomycetaceae TaxID=2062 RepID=UPI00367CD331
MCPEINAAVIESVEEGIASSCSLMVPCPGAAQAMRMPGRRPHVPFGSTSLRCARCRASGGGR